MPSTSALPPNPCLVAILLVIKTRAGPRLVFHYPQSPSATSVSARLDPAWYGNPSVGADDSDGFSSDWSSDTDGNTDEDNATEGSRASGGRASRQEVGGSGRSMRTKVAHASARDDLDENEVESSRDRGIEGGRSRRNRDSSRRRSAYEWNEVLGFGTAGLGKILSPGRVFDKRRHEVGIDELVFVGAPRFVREDGFWKKQKKKKKSKKRAKDKRQSVESKGGQSNTDNTDVDEGIDMTGDDTDDQDHVASNNVNSGSPSEAASDVGSDAKSTSTNGHDIEMSMFNIVLALNPPALEYQGRVREMYENVVKKFAKALKYEQANNNFVYRESRMILSMKDRAKEQRTPSYSLWSNIMRSSALAKSMVITYEAISTSKIAHVNLSTGFDTSFQIPQAISTPSIPTSFEPQMPGLWLTTSSATLMNDDETEASLSPHSALLLLEDEDILLKEIESDVKELAGPLSFFIRNLTPTKSLLKLSQMHSMSLKDLQLLARHLIFWRRARAIPPLRPRDTYIVSPNADLRALKAAIPAFAARFPSLPPLPKILQSLSGAPKPYAVLMPSKDHKPIYMDILAWLMRDGWVTQLRTFAWLVVSPKVKAAVAAKMYKDSEKLRQSQVLENRRSGDMQDLTASNLNFNGHGPGDGAGTTSPRVSTYLSPTSLGPEEPFPTSGKLAMPPGKALSPVQQAQSMFRRPSPLNLHRGSSPNLSSPSPTTVVSPSLPESPVASLSPSFDPAAYTASLVHSPQKANALESRWIDYISSTFTDEELREMWPRFLKYFDGRHALEIIPVREGMKKKRVGLVLGKLMAGGWIMTVRHW